MLFFVKDGSGNGLTNNIHLQATGSNDIDGSTNDEIIDTAYGKAHYVYSGGGTNGHFYSL